MASSNNILSGNKSTGNTTADITDSGTSTTSYCGIEKYDTGWINRSDWTNVHLGTDDTKDTDSNVTHGLAANLSQLLVKVLISTDGTDANSFECQDYMMYNSTGTKFLGITPYQVDTNNITVQTGTFGLAYITAAGIIDAVDTEDWYYKIVVYKIG